MAVGGALFGGNTGRSQSKSLVEFRAGKMNLNATTKMVHPDKRKGLVSVYQSDDQLMHFTWKDRGTGNLEDDLIIFPDDVEFKAVPACTTGRAFVLKFKSSNKRMFFWMQEPKTEKDEELCKKVNDNLNNPPAPGSSRSGAGGAGLGGGAGLRGIDFSNLGDAELQNLLNNMSQQQLMQLFGGNLGSGSIAGLSSLLGGGRTRQAAGGGRTRPPAVTDTPTTPTTPTTVPVPAPTPGGAGPQPAIQLSDLQSILSGIQVPPGQEAVGGAAGGSGPAVDLSSGLTGEALQPILSSPGFLEKVREFLPQGEKEDGKEFTAEDLKGTVQSPQFQQAVSMFSLALQSGQLGPLISQFGLGEAATEAAAKGDMAAFVKALQDEKKEKKDEQEDMALD